MAWSLCGQVCQCLSQAVYRQCDPTERRWDRPDYTPVWCVYNLWFSEVLVEYAARAEALLYGVKTIMESNNKNKK